ncbi:hypothetical protein [Phyllobacterium sp. K27]
MPKFIATYDLRETNPSPHSTFLDQATKNGWALWILSDKDEWYRLPNTTLVGVFDNRPAAVAALKATRSATEKTLGRDVTMEKWIVTDYSGSTFDSDVHQPKK